jgi:hypothetical protein
VSTLTPLSAREQVELLDLERVVRLHISRLHRAAQALLEIRDRRLYRATHTSWEAYCQERWGFSRAHGYRLIAAADVARDVSPTGDTINERQARELVPLTTEQRRDVWQQAQEDGRPTAARIADLAAKALAGLSPADQQATIQEAERRVLQPTAGGKDRSWIETVERWATRGQRLLRQQVGTERAAELLDQVLTETRKVV